MKTIMMTITSMLLLTALVNESYGNLLNNGDFSGGTTGWTLQVIKEGISPSNATGTVVNGEYVIDITNDDGTDWHIALWQYNVSLNTGETYTMSFDARAQSPRTVVAVAQLNEPPWTTVVRNAISITTTMQRYTLTFTNNASTSGNYKVGFFLGAEGLIDVTVDNIVLTGAGDAPVITSHPASQTVTEGGPASFSVSATGTAPLTYKWQKNEADIPGETNPFLLISSTVLSDAGQYRAIVSNSYGSATSNSATLTVTPIIVAPEITDQPDSKTVTVGQSVTFSVTATGTVPLSYQWKRFGLPIQNATSSTYTIPSASLADNGAEFAVWVGNAAGEVASAPAVLTVIQDLPQSKKLAISGELYDDANNPVGYPSPATVDMTIVLYDAPTAGNELYTETFLADNYQAITVDEALFVARLGEGTGSGDLQQVVSANANIWVEIRIDDDGNMEVLSPRTPLTASAYSLAGTSAYLQGEGDPSTNGTSAGIGTFYVNTTNTSTWVKLANGWKPLD